MKILTIGDVHGRDTWKTSADISILFKSKGSFIPDYDKYIFVGDYTDSHDKSNVEILHNLIEIIEFKRMYPDHVNLLLGNHDLYYWFIESQFLCSGVRQSMMHDLHDVFRRDDELFDIAYQVENYLWTHAGIHRGWYERYFLDWDSEYISTVGFNLADRLNQAFKEREETLFMVGRRRGGFNDMGGPLWLDSSLLMKKPLKGYHQIVGHTARKEVKTWTHNKSTSVTVVDAPDNPLYELTI